MSVVAFSTRKEDESDGEDTSSDLVAVIIGYFEVSTCRKFHIEDTLNNWRFSES